MVMDEEIRRKWEVGLGRSNSEQILLEKRRRDLASETWGQKKPSKHVGGDIKVTKAGS